MTRTGLPEDVYNSKSFMNTVKILPRKKEKDILIDEVGKEGCLDIVNSIQ